MAPPRKKALRQKPAADSESEEVEDHLEEEEIEDHLEEEEVEEHCDSDDDGDITHTIPRDVSLPVREFIFYNPASVVDHDGPLLIEQPARFTTWALLNSVQYCSKKVLPILEGLPRNHINLRGKMMDGVDGNYTFSIASSRNAHCIVKQVYGRELVGSTACDKCRANEGALIGCVVNFYMGKSCANCEWNGGNGPCSLASVKDERTVAKKSPRKRKRVSQADMSDDDAASMLAKNVKGNPAHDLASRLLGGLSSDTCELLSRVFTKLSRR